MTRIISLTIASLFILVIITNSFCTQKDSAIEVVGQQDQQVQKPLSRVDDANLVSYDQIRLFSPESQKLVFSKMNGANKARLWLERISYVASLYKNSEKKEKILELRSFISPELFSNKLHLSNVENEINLWIARSVPLLGYNNLRLIMTTLMELKPIDPKSEDFSEVAYEANPCPPCPDPNWCTCSRQSDWCIVNKCGPAGCIVGPAGCGTFLVYECNGKCGATLGEN